MQVIKTINEPSDVYILGDFYSEAKGGFGVKDDYSGTTISNGVFEKDLLCAGFIYIYTREELIVELERFGYSGEWDSDSDYAMVIHGYQGTIELEVTNSNGVQLEFNYKPDEYVWDMLNTKRYDYDTKLILSPGTIIPSTCSIQDALSLPSLPINNQRPVERVPLTRVNLPVLSYCAIPQEITDGGTFLNEYQPGCYVTYVFNAEDNTELNDWLHNTYPELSGTEFLIDIDY